MTKLIVALLSLLAGVASSTQGLYNGYWKERIDLKTILLANSLVVFISVAILYLVTANEGLRFPLDKMSPSILIGGVCGFFIIMVFAIAFPAIGATATSLLFISGLLVASLFYDAIGAMGLAQSAFTLQRFIGVVLVVAGSYIALKS